MLECGVAGKNSQQVRELFLGQAGFADQGAKRAFGQFTVIRDGQTPSRWMPQNEVAAGLMIQFVTDFAESFDGVRTRADGKPAHTGISMI